MAYLPIEISRRLIVGWQIPLSIFAAYGLASLVAQTPSVSGRCRRDLCCHPPC